MTATVGNSPPFGSVRMGSNGRRRRFRRNGKWACQVGWHIFVESALHASNERTVLVPVFEQVSGTTRTEFEPKHGYLLLCVALGPLFLFFQPRLSLLNLLGRAGSSWNFVVACQLRYRFSSELHYGHLWRATRGLAPKQLGVIHPIPVGKLAKAGARSKSVSIQWTGQWSGSEGVIDGGLGRCAHPLSVCRSGVESLCSNR